MLFTDEQSSRDSEFGFIKFRNSILSRHNFLVIDNHGFTVAEYHKTRAATNHFYFVVRYFPPAVSRLAALYCAFIRHLSNLFNNQISYKLTQLMIRFPSKEHHEWLICMKETNDLFWNGIKLSEVLQRETAFDLMSK